MAHIRYNDPVFNDNHNNDNDDHSKHAINNKNSKLAVKKEWRKTVCIVHQIFLLWIHYPWKAFHVDG